ncbi:MAG: hypothetical protein M1826_003490 [Phylliscum demangeonii]|nr:MAG: hypothetical protein M1826_003490 [Phylliscum demangeonii]
MAHDTFPSQGAPDWDDHAGPWDEQEDPDLRAIQIALTTVDPAPRTAEHTTLTPSSTSILTSNADPRSHPHRRQQLLDAAASGRDARQKPTTTTTTTSDQAGTDEQAHHLGANNASSQRMGLTRRLRRRPLRGLPTRFDVVIHISKPPAVASSDASAAAFLPARSVTRHERHHGSTTDHDSRSQKAEEEQKKDEHVFQTPPTHRQVQIQYQRRPSFAANRGVATVKLSRD